VPPCPEAEDEMQRKAISSRSLTTPLTEILGLTKGTTPAGLEPATPGH
jgi:hypothetical protein